MLTPPSPAQAELARRLLVEEGANGSTEACATAAGRVYDKIRAHLAPLLGATGVDALLTRSAKLTQDRLPGLATASLDSTKLQACLAGEEPAVAMGAAVALFATFFALITTFIGERLTTQALRRAWPHIDETAPQEKKQ